MDGNSIKKMGKKKSTVKKKFKIFFKIEVKKLWPLVSVGYMLLVYCYNRSQLLATWR